MKWRTFLIEIGDFFYYAYLAWQLRDAKSVLDVGCGSNSPLVKVPKHFYSVGVDIHKPSIAASRKRKIHDDYRVGDVLDIGKIFSPKSFDAVLALDLIEHLPQKEGYQLIRQMVKLARQKAILLTPHGFIPQHPYDGNPFQKHLSGWSIKDFQRLGFRVRGMRGLASLRGEYATLKYRPWFFWGLVSSLSEILVFFYPKLAHQLFVVKDLD